MNHPPDSERAISDVFGAVILIGVIVTVFAVAGVMMFSQPQPQKIPALNALISTNAQTIDIHHGGGDAFNFADIQILVDGVPKRDSFKLEGTNDWSTWSVGQSLICTTCDPTGVIQIVYTAGPVSQVIAQAGEDRAGTMGTLPVPAPVVTAITPNTAPVGNVVSITNIAGSGFFNGATVKLSRAGSTDITASNVVVVSVTRITCDFDLTGSTPGGAAWDVVVTNPGGPSGTLANAFTMTAALPPVANFNGTPLSGTVPLTVSFTDLSTNFPDFWFWEFGDGNTSSSQNPSYTYLSTGTYSVNLTATNTAGSSKLVRTNYITVIPLVTYRINATAVPPGGSISPSGVVIVVAGNNQNFTISADTGYNIADVRVNNVSQGMIPDYTFTNVAANHTITATFAINQFTINATSGPNGTVTPAGLTLVNYGANQTYNITPSTGYHVDDVLVNNASVGAVPTYTFTNVIANQTISATFAINQYTITPSVAGGNGVISPDTVQTVNYGATPTFNFTPDLGFSLYNITVNSILVTPTGNNSYTFPPVTENKTIVVRFLINPPVANFTGTPRSGARPLNVSFTDTSTNSPSSWLWNFGDGNLSSLQNPTNTYVAAGNYSVRLEATNAGGTNVSVKEGYIFVYVPAVANFTGSPTSGPVSLTVAFTDLSTGSPSSFYWQFGSNATVNTSTNQNPGHTYTTVGRYSVNLTVANTYSSSYLLRTNYINATVAPPVAAIYNATSNIGLAPLTVELWDMSTNDPTSWLWKFGAGGPADVTTQDATPTFTNPGRYNVSLTATNAGGSSTAYMIVNAIQVPTVTSVAPATGSTSGGNTVTIIGTNLLGASVATFGGTGATGVSVINATAVSAITPAHAQGIVTVNVTTPNGTATGPNVFTYAPPPTVTSVAPSTGPVGGNKVVTIIGTNLLGASAATFDGLSATSVAVVNATAVTATTPAHPLGTVTVNVTTPNGTASGPNVYTYVAAPTITGISPQYGIRAVGTRVNITGTNLVGANSGGANGVTFAGSAATINANSATVINMTAPAGTGTVTVTVTTPNGTATTTYNYFIIQIFTSSTTWSGPTGMVGIDYLVVAGGGGGGGLGGGGGAGGVRFGTLTTGLTGAKTVTIGAGGAGGTTARASNGGNSVFATITATGGGGGGTSSGTSGVATGAAGGSGGGGARQRAGGARTAGQGNIGGTGGGNTVPYEGGGGGGNLTAGATATNLTGGAGGAGQSYSATFGTGFGVGGVVAGGGGGGVASGTAGAGGAGGGGAGGVGNAVGTAGTVNTGGGGGGSGNANAAYRGGTGGSGVVVIRYY